MPEVAMNGEVRRLLRDFKFGCGWTCTTCGGHSFRVRRLKGMYRRNRTGYLAELTGLSSADFEEIGDAAPLARAGLDVIPSVQTRQTVLDSWADTVANDPAIAIVVLHIAGPNLQLSARLVSTMLALSRQRSVLAVITGDIVHS